MSRIPLKTLRQASCTLLIFKLTELDIDINFFFQFSDKKSSKSTGTFFSMKKEKNCKR